MDSDATHPGPGHLNASCVHVLKKHTAAVLNVEFTSNGAYCISTSQDKSLVLWNPAKGTAIKQYSGPHNHEVNDVTIAADNAKFVSAGGDKTAFLWDVTTGNVIRKFPGHNGKINCCKLAAGDDVLFTGSCDKLLRAWDVRVYQAQKPIQSISDAKDAISSVMLPDRHQVLVTSIDGAARCYDVRKGCVSLDQFPAGLLRGDLTHDSRCYVVNGLDDCVRLVELGSGQLLNTFGGHKSNNYLLNAQFTPDDAFVVSGSEDGRVCVWDICTPADASSSPSPSASGNGGSKGRNSSFAQVLYPPSLDAAGGSRAEGRLGACVFSVRFHPKEWLMVSCHNDRALRVWRWDK